MVDGKRKILIIEDQEINRQILKTMLSFDYTVYEAEDGKKGLDILQEHYQDLSLVILDMFMPVMDGYEVLKAVKSDPILKNIPVIVATGSHSDDEEERCLASGATDFVTKPYKPNIVLSRIKNIITLRESTAVLSAVEYDELTGVLSRPAFIHHAGLILKRNPEKRYSLLISDMDDFKSINEKYGEDFGNRMLLHGASFLKQAMDYGIPVGRYGADQFVSLVEYDEKTTNEETLMGMINAIKNSFPVEGMEMRVGIYDDVDHNLPISVLCDRALIAVRSISHQFGKNIAYYDDNLRKKIELEKIIELDMKKAYDEEQFKVFYQPKHDTTTGKLVGAEALIRWEHPELGFLSPAAFIPIFEKNGFVSYADYFVWTRVCKSLRKWIDKGLNVVPVSVNTSRRDYAYPDYMNLVLRPVKENNLDPSYLHLEVTESLFAENPDELNKKIIACKEAGFQIELDDFGAGYSSPNLLGTIPFDVVKFDMAFMSEIENEKKAKVLAACINLAQSLGMKTLAEGVETEAQRELLKTLHCNSIQGYYFSKPLSEEEFEKYLISCAETDCMREDIPYNEESDTGMYIVDEDYTLVMINDVMRERYPQLKLGKCCHKCLMNLDEPCAICPVKNKITGTHTYLDPIRSVYESVQVVNVHLSDDKPGYALILNTLK